ncbi:hypothetical protein PUMCH_000894 [Australozyma saopauloensis]|uniref:Increased recombination centers protein 22 n=1 Tax=Australozyma saopauloensis TaxID=291208 RepID=A0AAX4H6N8_9ASCO|nr:hypothetical protein PUMCH_000894 [[Candida] saopauloensis]
MKFSLFALALAAFTGAVSAAEPQQNINPEKVAQDESDPTSLLNFDLSYIIENQPELGVQQVLEILNSDPLSIYYTLVNNEEHDITVMGLGGVFLSPLNGEPVVNITASSIGPIVIKSGEKDEFRQKVNLDMDTGNYVLVPNVYAAYQGKMKVVDARQQMVSVTEVPLSLLNPQLLFVELVMLAVVAGLVQFFYPSFLSNYFKGTAPVKVPRAGKSSGSSTAYDPNWIPKSHLSTTKKTKTRKAY